jgi:hypothetical protein
LTDDGQPRSRRAQPPALSIFSARLTAIASLASGPVPLTRRQDREHGEGGHAERIARVIPDLFTLDVGAVFATATVRQEMR